MYPANPLVVPDHIIDAADEVANFFEANGQPVWRLNRLQAFVPMPPPNRVDIALPIAECAESACACNYLLGRLKELPHPPPILVKESANDTSLGALSGCES